MSAAAQALQSQQQQRRRRLVVGQLLAARPGSRSQKNGEKPTAQQADSKGGGSKIVSDDAPTADPEAPMTCAAKRQALAVLQGRYPTASYLNPCAASRAARKETGATVAQRPCPGRRWCQPLPLKQRPLAPVPPTKSSTGKQIPASNLADNPTGPCAALRDLHGLHSIKNPPPLPPLAESESAFLAAHTSYANDMLDLNGYEDYNDSLLESASLLGSPFGSFDEEYGLSADALYDRWPRPGASVQRRKQPQTSVLQQPSFQPPLRPPPALSLTSPAAGAAGDPECSASAQRPTTALGPGRATASQPSTAPESLSEDEMLQLIDRKMAQVVDAVCWAQESLAGCLQGLHKRNLLAETEAEKRVHAICEGIRNSLISGEMHDKEIRSECELIKKRLHVQMLMASRSEQKNLAIYDVRWPQELYEQMQSKSSDELSRAVDAAMPGWIVYAQGDMDPAAMAWGLLVSMAQKEEGELRIWQGRGGGGGGGGGGREHGRPKEGPFLKVLASAVTGAALLTGGSSAKQPLDPLACALLCPVHFKLITLKLKVPKAFAECSLISIANLYDIIFHLSLELQPSAVHGSEVLQSQGSPRFTSSVVDERLGLLLLQPLDALLRVSVVKGILEKESDSNLDELVKELAYVRIAEELAGDEMHHVLSEWDETFLDPFANLEVEVEEGVAMQHEGGAARPPRSASQASSGVVGNIIGGLPEDIIGCCIYDCFWQPWNGRVFDESVAGGSKPFEDDIVNSLKLHGLLDLEYDTSAEDCAMDLLSEAEQILAHFHSASLAAEKGCTKDTTQEVLQVLSRTKAQLVKREITQRRVHLEWREQQLRGRPHEVAVVQQYEENDEVFPPALQVDIEALYPGLLEAHPHSWGRLVKALNQCGSGTDHSLDVVAKCAMLGLTALVGMHVPVKTLRLTACVAAGYVRLTYDDLDSGNWHDEGDQDEHSHSDRAIMKAIDTFHILTRVPPLRFHLIPRTGWTCAPPPPSSHLRAASGLGLPLHHPKRQEALGVMLTDTMERILVLPCHYKTLARCIELKVIAESAQGTERETQSMEQLQSLLEDFAWVLWKQPLWQDVSSIDAEEARLQVDEEELEAAEWEAGVGASTSGRENGGDVGRKSGSRQPLRQSSYSAQQSAGAKWLPPPPPPQVLHRPPVPCCHQHLKPAAHLQHHHHHQKLPPQTQQPSQSQRAVGQSAGVPLYGKAPQHPHRSQPSRPPSMRTEMPCLNATSSFSDAISPLVSAFLDWRREEGRTPPPPPPGVGAAAPAAVSRPPVSMAAVGPERNTLLLMILFHMSDIMKGDTGSSMTHNRLGFRVMACKASRAGSSRIIPHGKDAPRPAPSDLPDMILLSDIQPVVVPGCHDPKHTHGFEWATIMAKTLLVTATSKWSTYMRSLQQALIKKKLGAIWLCGTGVEGVQRALLMIAKIQEEMQESGMCSHVCVTYIQLFNRQDSPSAKGNRNQRRRSSTGGVSSIHEPIIDGSHPGYELECLVQGLHDLVQQDEHASGWISSHRLRAEEKASGHAAYLLDALSYSDSLLRQEVTVEFRLTQCEHQRPDVPVLPRGEGAMQQRWLRDALLQRP